MSTLLFKDLGEMDYLSALSLQERLVEAKRREGLPDMVLLVQHPHVFTIGRGGKESHLLSPGDVPVYRTSRGGDVTYHGPGQMVVYPLLDLGSKLRKDVHRYLRHLEATLIETLKRFGLQGARLPPWTGIWIGKKKIASIGIAVRKGITYHGVALNVSTDLTYFQRIIPCGLAWAEITSLERELDREFSIELVKENFLRHFVRAFRYAEFKELCHEDIQIGSRSEPRAVLTTCVSNGS
ncbi:lipoyl(octanoyl) transferase [bacterium]|nr:MAG: lipoyl(octanoyl) transferase [bacterium]